MKCRAIQAYPISTLSSSAWLSIAYARYQTIFVELTPNLGGSNDGPIVTFQADHAYRSISPIADQDKEMESNHVHRL